MSEVNVELWKQANQVYAELMDLTVSDALNQLSQMQNLDDELKGLILTLISSGNQPSQYFKQHVSANFKLDELYPSEFKPGDQIGGYELLEELGVGGMAKVFKAHKLGADSQKPVAIKIFKHLSVSPILLNRFAVEQDILSGLSHPNIVNMHHGGTSDKGVPYIVMELIEQAQDIDVYAETNSVSQKQIVQWVLSAAKAIAYAHNNLIVHRDIKPSNLMIADNGTLKVVDFGIAKLMSNEDAPQKTTIMALTPSFAAPEQINSGQISVTTDVFSLAAVCLALIIEKQPLPTDRLFKSCAGDEAHIWQLLKTEIKDKDLRNILNHALQQDPLKRYRNMDLFVDDLSAWLAQKPVMATPDSWLYRSKKFALRRRALFAALTTSVAMVLIGIVLLGWQVEKTQAEAAKANEVKDFMLGVFSVVNPDDALGEKILAKDLLSQASAEIKAKGFKDSSIKVELLTAMGQAQLQLGLNHQANDSFSEALVINQQTIAANIGVLKTAMAQGDMVAAKEKITVLDSLVSTNHILMPDLLLLKSQIASNSGDNDLAEKQAREAQLKFELQDNIKGYLESGRQLANIMYLKSESKSGAEYLEQQLTFGLEKLAPTSTVILAIQNDLVELYNDIGEYTKANNHTEKLIENIKTVLGEKHPFLIQAYISKAGNSRAIGKMDEAIKYANIALSLSTEINGEEHESTARAINLVAVMAYVNGDIETALTQMKRASELYDLVLGADHVDSWDIKTNLTALLNMVQRFDEAIEIIEPVFEKQKNKLGLTHKSTIYSQTTLARLYGDVGRLAEAKELGEAMLNVAKDELGFDHPLTIGGHFTLAKIYQKSGELDKAIALLEGVINNENWHDNNERVITMYNFLADLYAENKNMDAATTLKEKSLQVALTLLTEESPRTLGQMLNNAEFYLTNNDLGKATNYLNQVAAHLSEAESASGQLVSKLKVLQEKLAAKE